MNESILIEAENVGHGVFLLVVIAKEAQARGENPMHAIKREYGFLSLMLNSLNENFDNVAFADFCKQALMDAGVDVDSPLDSARARSLAEIIFDNKGNVTLH